MLSQKGGFFEKVILVVNNKSTRGRKEKSKVSSWLKKEGIPYNVFCCNSIQETKEIIRAYSSSKNLIILVSGDGGYNVAVNQAVLAKDPPCVVVWPGGNANDWFSLFGNLNRLKKAILSGKTRKMDLLKITVSGLNHEGQANLMYAHSYIGFGITANAAITLDNSKHIKGKIIPESSIVLKEIVSSNQVSFDQKTEKGIKLRSLTIHNHKRMAKLFRIKNSVCDDNKFEVVALKHDLSLPMKIVKGILGKLEGIPFSEYHLFLSDETPIQIDGEVIMIPKESYLDVSIAHKVLYTLDWELQ